MARIRIPVTYQSYKYSKTATALSFLGNAIFVLCTLLFCLPGILMVIALPIRMVMLLFQPDEYFALEDGLELLFGGAVFTLLGYGLGMLFKWPMCKLADHIGKKRAKEQFLTAVEQQDKPHDAQQSAGQRKGKSKLSWLVYLVAFAVSYFISSSENAGVYFGALLVGLLWSLVPYFLGRYSGNTKMGSIGVAVTTVVGFLFGFIGGAVSAAVFAVLILVTMK